MPVYEYRCTSCSHELEEIQPMGSGPPGPCPSCGGDLKRTWGRVGIRFSGWGFHATDSLGDGRRDFKALERKAEELREG